MMTLTKPTKPIAFTFGEPIPMNGREIFDYVECWHNGRWYEPPVNLYGLSKSYKCTPYLSSGIIFKRNFLANLFMPTAKLSRKAFEQIALDFIWCGNAYLEEIRTVRGGVLRYQPTLAKYTRCGKDGRFFMLYSDDLGYQEHEFTNRLCHIKECDIDQEIYGQPEYYAALQSAWLNESATLFRRKYYNNGSHAGFIMYVNDPANDPNDIDALRQALKDSKGPGNFRNLFFYSPNGKKDGVQIIPVSEIAAKDDFGTIKNISRDDVLSALRIPPQLLGIIPTNAGGFGSIRDASEMFYHNEIVPLQARLEVINEWAGDEIVRFKDHQ
ncbi:phage portal protein [Moraxella sp. Pampa]|uniref:phage portal protein n=1 Tax=Moraxella sp. Pampa TaxID=3111978 RepID=UPI003A5CB103